MRIPIANVPGKSVNCPKGLEHVMTPYKWYATDLNGKQDLCAFLSLRHPDGVHQVPVTVEELATGKFADGSPVGEVVGEFDPVKGSVEQN